MKKYYIITVVAVAIVAILQGYNIFLQYSDYINRETERISYTLKISVDEEYAKRARENKHLHNDGKQRLYVKQMSNEDFVKAKPKNEDIIRINEYDIDALRKRGLIATQTDVIGLIGKDRMEAKGKPINLDTLSIIFRKNLKQDLPFVLLILDEKNEVLQYFGSTKNIKDWKDSKPFAIGLKPVRFIMVKVDIPLSSFFISSIGSLVFMFFLALVVIFCVGYQMTVIRNKEDLLKNRETCINGTVHDLKAPLASVLLTLGFVKNSLNDVGYRELLESAERQIERLATTIKTILIAARAGENCLVLNRESIDILKLAQDVKEIVDVNYVYKMHTIAINDCRKGGQKLMGDRMLMGNVLQNLMENAVKYSNDKAFVEVDISNDDHYIRIDVKDQGVGMERKYLKKIFRQFYRIPATHHRSGYGIGLAVVMYVVKAHGGIVKVKSDLGKGSVFTVLLPFVRN